MGPSIKLKKNTMLIIYIYNNTINITILIIYILHILNKK